MHGLPSRAQRSHGCAPLHLRLPREHGRHATLVGGAYAAAAADDEDEEDIVWEPSRTRGSYRGGV